MTLQAFYKQRPTQDTPYRTLVVEHKLRWQVRLSGGRKWGPKNRQDPKVIPANSFDEAMELYNKAFNELQEEGWKPYSPHESWF